VWGRLPLDPVLLSGALTSSFCPSAPRRWARPAERVDQAQPRERASSPSVVTLPDMKLTRRFPAELAGEGLDRVEQVLREVAEMKRAG